MSDPLVVRQVNGGDVAVLAGLGPSWNSAVRTLFTQQERGRCTLFAAWLGSLPVGLAELTSASPPELRSLQVLEAHRGSGYGTALVRAVERAAAPAGVLRLGVDAENHSARRLYERLGYEPTGVVSQSRYRYVDDDGISREATELNIEMEKPLSC